MFTFLNYAFSNKMFKLLITIIVALCYASAYEQDCKSINFGSDSVVCECNSTYCDFYPDPKLPNKGEFIWYVSSQSGKRLSRSDGKISTEFGDGYKIKINSDEQYQSMEGFGGAFTDAACSNIKSLSQGAQNNLMRSYFSTAGSKYNFGRVPIGGSDFSTRPYTYDDTDGDVNLKKFTLANEDYQLKIPLMTEARKFNPSLRFLSAAWTAPVWMKDRPKYNEYTYLLDTYYQTYADYIIKFLEEYKKNGLEMWAVSTGNEPYTALISFSHINKMYWSAKTASKWVLENLGPTLEKSNSNDTIILMLDDQRLALPWYVIDFKLRNKDALKYIKGVAVHWYADDFVPAAALTATHALVPDKFILITEACVGDRPWEYPKVILGSWRRAERLIEKLFQNINHWVVGWVDWNLALNLQGGPNWVGNNVDAPIIVVSNDDVFYKQPLYYAMTHFSKFVPRSSVRIEATSENNNILTTAFKTNDKEIVVLLYNKYDEKKNVSIVDDKIGSINVELLGRSLHTILYTTV